MRGGGLDPGKDRLGSRRLPLSVSCDQAQFYTYACFFSSSATFWLYFLSPTRPVVAMCNRALVSRVSWLLGVVTPPRANRSGLVGEGEGRTGEAETGARTAVVVRLRKHGIAG
jgi:hypothetical protein